MKLIYKYKYSSFTGVPPEFYDLVEHLTGVIQTNAQ